MCCLGEGETKYKGPEMGVAYQIQEMQGASIFKEPRDQGEGNINYNKTHNGLLEGLQEREHQTPVTIQRCKREDGIWARNEQKFFRDWSG